MTSPRVLFVNHAGVLGGAERILLDTLAAFTNPSLFVFETGPLAAAAAERGARVLAGGLPQLAGFKRDSALRAALPLAGALLGLMPRLVRAARRHDILYANSQKAFTLAAIAARLARRPLVWHLHDILSREHFGATQIKLQIRLANAAAQRVIAPSQAVADAFVAAGGNARRVVVVANGLDAPTVRGTALRASLGLTTPKAIGVFSRLSPWKGQHVVLRALADLPDVSAVFAGDALFGEDDYARSVQTLAKDLGLGDRVRFLGHREDVVDIMHAVDVVVHPSVLAEPFGRTLVEGMLARKPVIATATGAAEEILDRGAAGILVPPGDAAALASALRSLDADHIRAERLVERAYARAIDLYGVERMRRGVRTTVEEVMARAA